MNTIGRILLLLLLITTAAKAETRIALVIGNADYQSAPALQNTAQDARSMAERLKADHFDVIFRENLGRRDFNRAIDELREPPLQRLRRRPLLCRPRRPDRRHQLPPRHRHPRRPRRRHRVRWHRPLPRPRLE